MKKIFLAFIVCAIASSCSALKEVPTERVVIKAFSDYRQYSAEGFLISPDPYTYHFEGIGELDIIIEPARELKEKPSLYKGGSSIKTLVDESIPQSELVDIAVKEAKEKGADALVNFSITKEKITEVDRIYGGYKIRYIYYIKGYCIKRK